MTRAWGLIDKTHGFLGLLGDGLDIFVERVEVVEDDKDQDEHHSGGDHETGDNAVF